MFLFRSSLAVLLVGFLPLEALQVPDRIRVRGEIFSEQGLIQGPLQVELRMLDGRSTFPGAPVHSDGSFELGDIEAGTYSAVITTLDGTPLYSTLVQISAIDNRISIRWNPNSNRQSPAGKVSFGRLNHKVPKAARKELEKAQQSREHNRLDEALAHLKKAVEIDPGYLEAHNNLGSMYMRMGNLAAAHAPLARAIELEPGFPEAYCNLSALALKEGDAFAGERYVRRAILLGAEPQVSSYLLGLSLAGQNRPAEAAPLLEEASPRFPHARQVLAAIKGLPSPAPAKSPAPATAYRQRSVE